MRMNFYICLEIPKVFSFFYIFKLHLLWGKTGNYNKVV